MKILYVINTGLVGGLQRHVVCLMESLKDIAETAVVINTEIDPQLVPMLEDRGGKVYRLHGKSGHDWRIVRRFRKVLSDFKPDVIHAHGLPLFCLFYLCLVHRKTPMLHSIHTPAKKPPWWEWFAWKLLEWRICYWLPVSSATWEAFKKWHPWAQGEVFFNPLRLSEFKNKSQKAELTAQDGKPFVVGMVGRKAEVKDWPSFHKVERLVKGKMSEVVFLNAGEEHVCDGRAAIEEMNLFLMTSKSEQLPTTVLECFALGTPVCGFLPQGGLKDILEFSNGSVRGAFVEERDCRKLAQLVVDLIGDKTRRRAMVEDGRRIVQDHFSAEKLVPGQLMDIYRRFVK